LIESTQSNLFFTPTVKDLGKIKYKTLLNSRRKGINSISAMNSLNSITSGKSASKNSVLPKPHTSTVQSLHSSRQIFKEENNANNQDEIKGQLFNSVELVNSSRHKKTFSSKNFLHQSPCHFHSPDLLKAKSGNYNFLKSPQSSQTVKINRFKKGTLKLHSCENIGNLTPGSNYSGNWKNATLNAEKKGNAQEEFAKRVNTIEYLNNKTQNGSKKIGQKPEEKQTKAKAYSKSKRTKKVRKQAEEIEDSSNSESDSSHHEDITDIESSCYISETEIKGMQKHSLKKRKKKKKKGKSINTINTSFHHNSLHSTILSTKHSIPKPTPTTSSSRIAKTLHTEAQSPRQIMSTKLLSALQSPTNTSIASPQFSNTQPLTIPKHSAKHLQLTLRLHPQLQSNTLQNSNIFKGDKNRDHVPNFESNPHLLSQNFSKNQQPFKAANDGFAQNNPRHAFGKEREPFKNPSSPLPNPLSSDGSSSVFRALYTRKLKNKTPAGKEFSLKSNKGREKKVASFVVKSPPHFANSPNDINLHSNGKGVLTQNIQNSQNEFCVPNLSCQDEASVNFHQKNSSRKLQFPSGNNFQERKVRNENQIMCVGGEEHLLNINNRNKCVYSSSVVNEFKSNILADLKKKRNEDRHLPRDENNGSCGNILEKTFSSIQLKDRQFCKERRERVKEKLMRKANTSNVFQTQHAHQIKISDPKSFRVGNKICENKLFSQIVSHKGDADNDPSSP
jgi:hypothetical protein